MLIVFVGGLGGVGVIGGVDDIVMIVFSIVFINYGTCLFRYVFGRVWVGVC